MKSIEIDQVKIDVLKSGDKDIVKNDRNPKRKITMKFSDHHSKASENKLNSLGVDSFEDQISDIESSD